MFPAGYKRPYVRTTDISILVLPEADSGTFCWLCQVSLLILKYETVSRNEKNLRFFSHFFPIMSELLFQGLTLPLQQQVVSEASLNKRVI